MGLVIRGELQETKILRIIKDKNSQHMDRRK